MPRLMPLHWKRLECIFKKVGFIVEREHGDHIILVRKGTLRPVVIPKYKEVGVDIISSNMRTACMSREEFFELLKDC